MGRITPWRDLALTYAVGTLSSHLPGDFAHLIHALLFVAGVGAALARVPHGARMERPPSPSDESRVSDAASHLLWLQGSRGG
jgi:hypothetical protein